MPRFRIVLWALPFVACLGCGGSTAGQVEGRVTLNESPVTGAALRFVAADNQDHVFVGASGENGKYQIDYRTFEGLPPGKYQIVVTVSLLPGGVPFPPGERGDSLRAEGKLVETMYEFEQDIAAGSNEINLELNQGKKTPTKPRS